MMINGSFLLNIYGITYRQLLHFFMKKKRKKKKQKKQSNKKKKAILHRGRNLLLFFHLLCAVSVIHTLEGVML